jgi:hypothetical protein
MIIWVLFCCTMWFWAICSPIVLILVLIAFIGNPETPDIPGRDATEKLNQVVMVVFIALVGLAFVWLRVRGYLKFGERD